MLRSSNSRLGTTSTVGLLDCGNMFRLHSPQGRCVGSAATTCKSRAFCSSGPCIVKTRSTETLAASSTDHHGLSSITLVSCASEVLKAQHQTLKAERTTTVANSTNPACSEPQARQIRWPQTSGYAATYVQAKICPEIYVARVRFTLARKATLRYISRLAERVLHNLQQNWMATSCFALLCQLFIG